MREGREDAGSCTHAGEDERTFTPAGSDIYGGDSVRRAAIAPTSVGRPRRVRRPSQGLQGGRSTNVLDWSKPGPQKYRPRAKPSQKPICCMARS